MCKEGLVVNIRILAYNRLDCKNGDCIFQAAVHSCDTIIFRTDRKSHHTPCVGTSCPRVRLFLARRYANYHINNKRWFVYYCSYIFIIRKAQIIIFFVSLSPLPMKVSIMWNKLTLIFIIYYLFRCIILSLHLEFNSINPILYLCQTCIFHDSN